ncbi:hypothetical protein GYMLUDRAFT_233762 [Collybiopsis luxurians FD-317 M1]|uniref:Phosphatidylglycerol/phosphatidylinositol transfer protein n=1 Tax=Collybiopsis luxurians FD-317 M1 TaxID=944289 RepID=A0A0D0APB0_9AGAR|nr:hypothetical protein GYMLUDRAFT_233762 [Collybiopsis luxurians FD-317 M1]
MKSNLLFLFTLFFTAFSQTITILSPPAGTEVSPGQDVTVQLAFPNSLTGMEHISAVIGMINCAGATCPTDATDTLGIPLFMGNYTPQFHEGNLPPYQNFTVTTPSTLAAGTNMITAAQFMLVGASASPVLQFANVTVNTPANNRRATMVRGRVIFV